MTTTETALAPRERALADDETPVRGDLSIFLVTPASADPQRTYVDAFESIEFAESLGFGFAWVAEAHFSPLFGIPSALSFLAALSQRVSRIGLGTAVVPLAFDNPLRLAENSAVANVLAGDRLELGVGKGNPVGSGDMYSAFGLDEGDRDQLYATALAALKHALAGQFDLGDHVVELYPPAASILGRIWQATGNHATAAAAGAAGDGLMLFRTTPEGVAGDVQSALIDSYLREFDYERAEPRIGVSRSILLADSRAEAIKVAAAQYAALPVSNGNGFKLRPDNLDADSVEAHLRKTDVYFGAVDDVVEALNNDQAVTRSTNYLFNTPFHPSNSPRFREFLAALADEVYPRVRQAPDAFRISTQSVGG